MRTAFTLIELLVVVAIIAVLAAILFPVLSQAKAAAKKTAALSNSKQIALSYQIYAGDHEDRFPLALYTGTLDVESDSNSNYLVLPYVKSEELFFDPTDSTPRSRREHPEEYLPAPSTEAQRRFYIGLTANWGLNIQFIAPVFYQSPVTTPMAITTSEVARPANTLLAVGSIWGRTPSGTPYGGGNSAVDAPCWNDANGDLRPGPTNNDFLFYGGWNPSSPNAWNVFGGAWPWHGSGKQAIVAYTDGHVKAEPMGVLAAGCDVKDKSAGFVTDREKFIWASK